MWGNNCPTLPGMEDIRLSVLKLVKSWANEDELLFNVFGQPLQHISECCRIHNPLA